MGLARQIEWFGSGGYAVMARKPSGASRRDAEPWPSSSRSKTSSARAGAQHERACTERCIEIIEANLRLSLDLFDSAPPEERPVYARRMRQLSALLEYAVQLL